MEGTSALMKHERTAVILATGGHGIVRAAYSSGTPAFGVGPGNMPVLMDRSADIPAAVDKTVAGKTFDYGTVCSSEQALVAEEALRDRIVAELKARKRLFLQRGAEQALARAAGDPERHHQRAVRGTVAQKIAQMAGFEMPADTSIIVVEIAGRGARASALGGEALAGAGALFPAGLGRLPGHLRGASCASAGWATRR